MVLVALIGLILFIVLLKFLLRNSWKYYYQGIRDGKSGNPPKQKGYWYSRGYLVGLWKFEEKSLLQSIKVDPNAPKPVMLDPNGKRYTKFRWIPDGPNKGYYVAIHTFGAGTYERDYVAEAELNDIKKSGYPVFLPDPKG